MIQQQSIEAHIREYVLKTFPLARKHGVKGDDKWLEQACLIHWASWTWFTFWRKNSRSEFPTRNCFPRIFSR